MDFDGTSAGQIILSVNSGSSSLKFAVYRLTDTHEERLVHGAVEGIGLDGGRLWIRDSCGEVLADIRREFRGYWAAAAGMSAAAADLGLPTPAAAGHRVVHGGPYRSNPQRVDRSLLADLKRLVPFAPLHLPGAIQGIEAIAKRFPRMPQVACFDTAFHRRIPDVAQRFPLSSDLWDQGIRRYGFHGLSFEYIMSVLGTASKGGVVIAHLGNGASLAAVRDGQPLDTTMGFTPTGGLMMGTRSGDLDPGVLLHLMNEKGYTAADINATVNSRAGLLGVSAMSSDMKTLLDHRQHEPRAAQAVELFCYQLRKHIAAMTAVTGGLDTLVFTGGIGERAAPVRWEVCQGLDYLGIRLDPQRNAENADTISEAGSASTVRVIPTNEDLMIARHARVLLFTNTKCA